MKYLYVVRHGESEEVRDEVYYGPEQSLTERGFEEARLAGERFKMISFEKIITSPWKRARQTAEEIQKATGVAGEEYLPLHELEVPEELYGKKKDTDDVRVFKEAKEAHAHDPLWHYAQEEHFAEASARVGGALQALALRSEERVLAVTHHKIIKLMLGRVLFGEAFTPLHFQAIYEHLTLSPAGITLLEYTHDAWHILIVNDRAHLGE